MIRGFFLALPFLIVSALPAQASFFGRVFGSPPAIIEEADGDPSLSGRKIVFPNGTLTDQGSGVVLVSVATSGDVAAVSASTAANKALIDLNTTRLVEVAIDTAAHAAATTAHGAASANIANRIVLRDGAGGFSAQDITASNFLGNATTASTLQADGANCSVGAFPQGTDAAGAVQNCQINLSGTADFANDFATTPTLCAAGLAPRGIATDGDALNCTEYTTPAQVLLGTSTAFASFNTRVGSWTVTQDILSAGLTVTGSGLFTSDLEVDGALDLHGSLLGGIDGVGLDAAGTDFEVSAGRGTGAGKSGNIVFFGSLSGGSGSTPNVLTPIMKITSSGTVQIGFGRALELMGTTGGGFAFPQGVIRSNNTNLLIQSFDSADIQLVPGGGSVFTLGAFKSTNQPGDTGVPFGFEVNFRQNNALSNTYFLTKSRLGGIVSDGDSLGKFEWRGHDGGDLLTPGARIEAFVDGTPGANDLPTEIRFLVTPDGSETPILALAIRQNGSVEVATSISIAGGTSIIGHLSATSSLDFGATSANTCDNLTMTVTGAADADTCALGVPTALASGSNTSFTCFVSAADTVTVRRCNSATGAASDPASATVRATVWKH